MNIVIAGAGTVGLSLAQYFSKLNYHVTLIEQNGPLCDKIKSKLDILVVEGKGSCPATLESADIKSADMLIAVTSDDETNLLACNFAMQYGVEKRIARLRSDMYTCASSIDLKQVGVTSVIEPEWEVVKKILQYIELPGVIETENFQNDNIYIRGYRVDEHMPISGKTLLEIRQLSNMSPILIVAIVRDGKSLPPVGDQKLLSGDKFVAIMPRDSFKDFRLLIDRKAVKRGKVIVSGDSLTAVLLAKDLEERGEKVILIDPDPHHGYMAAAGLEKVEVYRGDTMDSDILQELNAQQASCFIAAGKDAEYNVMACLMAKNLGVKMAIALRNDDRYTEFFNSLGVDYIVNPQDITANMIIEKILMAPIGAYLKLKTIDIEISRLKAHTKSHVVGQSLRQLTKDFRRAVIIGAIVRNDKVIIPWGDIVIEAGDEVITLCPKEHTTWVHKLFR